MARIFICNKASYVFQVAVFLLMLPSGQGVLDSDSAPNIMLKGRQITADMSFVYLLECSTLNTFHGCSVEMLLNNVTKETIRYSNYTCYNGKGICSPLQCTCSNECNKFSWNYTVTEELKHQIFKCDSRIQDNNYFYKVFASGFFKEGDFVDGQYAFEIVSKDQSGSHKVLTDKESTVTTVSKEQQNNSMYSEIKNLTTAVLCIVSLNWITCIIIILLFYVCTQRSKYMKYGKNKTDVTSRLLSDYQLHDMSDRRMSYPTYIDMLYGRMSHELRAKYIDNLDRHILSAEYDCCMSDPCMSPAQYKADLLNLRRLLAEYDDMLERRRLLAEYDDKLDCRMSRAQYEELSQDEESNDEENEGKHLTRRKSFKNIESAETCRSTTDKRSRYTIRGIKRSNTKFKRKFKFSLSAGACPSQNEDIDIFSYESSNDEEIKKSCFPSIRTMVEDLNSAAKPENCQQSDEIDKSHTLEKNKPKINERASRNGLAMKFHQHGQKQTCTLRSAD